MSDYFSELYKEEETLNILIIGGGVNFIDLAGAEWITNEVVKWQKRGGGIYFSGLKLVSQSILTKGGFRDQIGLDNFFKDKHSAIEAIYEKLDKNICENCTTRIFHEC